MGYFAEKHVITNGRRPEIFEKSTLIFPGFFSNFLKRFCAGWKDLCEISSKTPSVTSDPDLFGLYRTFEIFDLGKDASP